ncbi:MAG: alpha-hydroxy-acid oxidizing protein [Nevskiaceae bacterium]|nr:MAG: alpha-hydroxy-acid oxidizing protein [Nevskiaceae bacterium]TBR74161.1 MAG: alpha-hydroxy-acid oxidizing protein [Nevskiaceae bacterium]
MIISSATDYREAARRRLPRFLFDYIDGGAGTEYTLHNNIRDVSALPLKQRVLRNVAELSPETVLFGEKLAMPVILGPVGLTGMYARRGEVQAACAAERSGVPFVLSTVSVCSLKEVMDRVHAPIWFQLYVLKDRGFMRDVLERAQAVGITRLVFTVDMPVPGPRYRDRHSGMSGRFAPLRRYLQAITHPRWAFDVGLMGRPHDLGNISTYREHATGLEDYIGWLGDNFDPSISWADLEWIRDFWKGKIIIKGILDPDDARDAVRFGADGLIVSNHGGRQLDGALSSTRALPAIASAVGDELTVLADSGVRSGLDVLRLLALGAKSVCLGRAWAYALAADGGRGVENLLRIFEHDIRVTMALTGTRSIAEITSDLLAMPDTARP